VGLKPASGAIAYLCIDYAILANGYAVFFDIFDFSWAIFTDGKLDVYGGVGWEQFAIGAAGYRLVVEFAWSAALSKRESGDQEECEKKD
jgi:hypothetical protein